MLQFSLTCILLMLTSLGSVYPKHVRVSDQDKTWDFLIFTQHWPPTICKLWMDKKPHTCSLPKNPDDWTIHGIWPTKLGSMGPEFCNKTWLFDPDEVRPIEDELEQGWINIEANTNLYDLWAHEWNKHGTCAASINTLNSQIKYFTEGLSLLKNYTMSSILEEAGITPSDTKQYKVDDFHNAIRSKLGIEPEVECRFDKGVQYLFELRICFTKEMELMDCRTKIDLTYVSNCNKNRSVMYPETVPPPKLYLVHLYNLIGWLQWLTL